MHIALDGRHDDPALGLMPFFLLILDKGDEVRHRLFHNARRLHDLRQEHFARSEQITDDIHAVHQRAFNDFNRAHGLLARFFRILNDIGVDPLDQRMLQPLGHGPAAPFFGGLFGNGIRALKPLCQRDQPLG